MKTGMPRHPRIPFSRRHPRRSGGVLPLARLAGADLHVPGLLDLDLLLADLARDLLGVLDDPLADLDLLGHHGVLADSDLLLADGDADLLALADVPGGDPLGRGPAVHRGP